MGVSQWVQFFYELDGSGKAGHSGHCHWERQAFLGNEE